MKRPISFAAMLILAITLTACGGNATPGNDNPEDQPGTDVDQVQKEEAEDLSTGTELPFDITGDFFDMHQVNVTAPAQMRVAAEGGGYVVTCGESVSQPVAAEVDQVSGDVRLSGPMEKVNGQPPDQGSNWQLNASFNNRNGAPEASIYIMDVATNDQSSRIDGQFQKLSVRAGTYSYWKAEWRSDLGDSDWDNAVLAQGVEVKQEDGRFSFILAEGYVSDWLEPSNVSPSRCEFMDFSVTGPAGEKLEATVYLDYNRYYSTADVTVYNAERTDRLLSFTAYTKPDEGFPMEQYLGTYETEPGEEAHTVVVEADRLMVDGRYTVDFTTEDLLMRWRPLTITDTQTGETMRGDLTIYGEEGEFQLSLSDYDGKLQVVANK